MARHENQVSLNLGLENTQQASTESPRLLSHTVALLNPYCVLSLTGCLLEEPVEKRRLTPTQQVARAVMNFCSLRGYAASEFSRQAAPRARQMIIKQGCKLEANGLNLDGSWPELCSLKNQLACFCGRGLTPLLHSISHALSSPSTSACPAQPCRENSALPAPLPSHHLSYHIDAILTILLFTSHSPKAVAGAILNI